MLPPVHVACVGAGYFSQFHYESWKRMDEVWLVGACDCDLTRAEATGLPAYDCLEAMLEKQGPDLLDVILPPAEQAKALRTAIDAGIKWIICQKPFCQSLEEAQNIIAEAKAAGARIIVHENFRFQPWYRRIKSALDTGLLGQVQHLTFRLRPGDGQGADAYLDRQPYFRDMPRFLVHETGVHWVDVFRYLVGNPSAVYADLRQINPVIRGEDAGYLLFEHPGNVRSVLDANRHLDHQSDNLRRTMGEALIEGTNGTLTLKGDGSVWHRFFGETQETLFAQPDAWDGFGGDCVHALQSHVVFGLLDGRPLENEAKDYIYVIRIEE
ncbi:MAG: Gfo/Idh/MocA family oxidoreductase, partial [Pseudomonadota bacterium]